MGPGGRPGGRISLVRAVGCRALVSVSMLLLLSSLPRGAAATTTAATAGRGVSCRRRAAFLLAPKPTARPFTTPSAPLAGPRRPSPSRGAIYAAASAAASKRPPRGGGGGRGPRDRDRDRDREADASSPLSSSPPPPAAFPKCPHVRLRAGKARLFLEGNPLVYGEAVEGGFGGAVGEGDYVPVVDAKGNLIGKGVYNPHSMYRVRLLWHAREKGERPHAETLEGIVRRRVATAWATRRALGLPSAETDCFRLINGEGDRLSGLAADVFGSVCVVASSALWCERHREAIVAALEAELQGAGIRVVWRRSEVRLKQDGFEEEEEKDATAAPIDVKVAAQEEGAFVWGREHGLRYKIFPELGQKTGFYCDQRENRAMLGSLAQGKRVLDLFCYTGGYALAAGRGGAREVVGVDSSALAVDTAAENARANGLEGALSFVRSDVLDFVQGLHSAAGGGIPEAALFDIVVADPPKLAPSRRDLPRALHKYTKINRAAIAALRPGGLLLTHTCSAAMTQAPEAFRDMVRKSANDVGRSLTVLRVSHAAPCHVLNPSYPENEYLTAMLCMVM